MMIPPDQTIEVLRRFIDKIEVVGDCWLWTGAVNSKGYPQLRVGSHILYAHRIAHELFFGEIPSGLQVHHRCLNNRCVRPLHIEATAPEVNRYLQTLGVGDVYAAVDADAIPF